MIMYKQKMKGRIGYAVEIKNVGLTGVLVIEHTIGRRKVIHELIYVDKEVALGYTPKTGDAVVFEATTRDHLKFPYMHIENIRKCN